MKWGDKLLVILVLLVVLLSGCVEVGETSYLCETGCADAELAFSWFTPGARPECWCKLGEREVRLW